MYICHFYGLMAICLGPQCVANQSDKPYIIYVLTFKLLIFFDILISVIQRLH